MASDECSKARLPVWRLTTRIPSLAHHPRHRQTPLHRHLYPSSSIILPHCPTGFLLIYLAGASSCFVRTCRRFIPASPPTPSPINPKPISVSNSFSVPPSPKRPPAAAAAALPRCPALQRPGHRCTRAARRCLHARRRCNDYHIIHILFFGVLIGRSE
jgi:hypothetical protein